MLTTTTKISGSIKAATKKTTPLFLRSTLGNSFILFYSI
jgi:hypothetical protein